MKIDIKDKIKIAENMLGGPLTECQKILMEHMLKGNKIYYPITPRQRVSTTAVIVTAFHKGLSKNKDTKKGVE